MRATSSSARILRAVPMISTRSDHEERAVPKTVALTGAPEAGVTRNVAPRTPAAITNSDGFVPTIATVSGPVSELPLLRSVNVGSVDALEHCNVGDVLKTPRCALRPKGS